MRSSSVVKMPLVFAESKSKANLRSKTVTSVQAISKYLLFVMWSVITLNNSNNSRITKTSIVLTNLSNNSKIDRWMITNSKRQKQAAVLNNRELWTKIPMCKWILRSLIFSRSRTLFWRDWASQKKWITICSITLNRNLKDLARMLHSTHKRLSIVMKKVLKISSANSSTKTNSQNSLSLIALSICKARSPGLIYKRYFRVISRNQHSKPPLSLETDHRQLEDTKRSTLSQIW